MDLKGVEISAQIILYAVNRSIKKKEKGNPPIDGKDVI